MPVEKTTKKAAAPKAAKTEKVDESSAKVNWYMRHENDTGSPEYQIQLLNERITQLQGHLKINHKDYDAKRSLLRMVARRRQHLKYLKNNDLQRYDFVSKKVGIKV